MGDDDLHAVERWAGALLSRLQPSQRRRINQLIAQELRRSQAKRIAAQLAPDGSAYPARKQRKLVEKKGRIKRQKQQMFSKLRTATWLKIETSEHELAVGFLGRVARIARVHQEGLEDKVDRRGPRYKYPARQLLGFPATDREFIRDVLLRHVSPSKT